MYCHKLLTARQKSGYSGSVGVRNTAELTGRGYPLVEDRVQAGVMLYARTVERPVSRSEMAEVLGVSRSKVSLEVGRLIELGLLVEDGLAEPDGGRGSSWPRPRDARCGVWGSDGARPTPGGRPGRVRRGPPLVVAAHPAFGWPDSVRGP